MNMWFTDRTERVEPTFSPDSNLMAFVAEHISESRLYRYEIDIAEVATGHRVHSPWAESNPLELKGRIRAQPPHWTEDGKALVQAGEDGLYVFNTKTGASRLLGKESEPQGMWAGQLDAVLSPDATAMVILSSGGLSLRERGINSVASVLDLKTWTVRAALESPEEQWDGAGRWSRPRTYDAAQWSPDGRWIVLERSDAIVLWDGRSPDASRVLDRWTPDEQQSMPYRGGRAMTFRPGSSMLATLAPDRKEVRLWDTNTGARLGTLVLERGAQSMAFSADGSRLAVATTSEIKDGGAALLIFDSDTRSLVRTLHAEPHGSSSTPTDLYWGPKGRAIISMSGGGHVDLWNVDSDDPPAHLLDEAGSGPSAVTANGNFLLRGTTAPEIWDLRSRSRTRQIRSDGSTIRRLRLNREGTVAIAACDDHIDLYRLPDDAHITIRPGAVPSHPNTGFVAYADSGVFAGDANLLGHRYARSGANLTDVRLLGPEEVGALNKPSLAFDFVTGCSLAQDGH
jgi:WD40 repeat protein